MRLPTHRAPTPPGEILLEDWLKPAKLTQLALAKKMGVDIQLVNGIINGRRSVTAKTALLLALAIWAFCRAYYFAFYVLERYVDPQFRFAGLWSVVRYILQKRNHKAPRL